MRYGVATDFRASSSVHSDLFAHAMARAQYNPTIASVWSATRFAAGAACYSNIAFGSHGNPSSFSNGQIENAARCVQAAAELTRYRINGYCGRGLPHVNWFTSAETFFLAGMSPVGTFRTYVRAWQCPTVQGAADAI